MCTVHEVAIIQVGQQLHLATWTRSIFGKDAFWEPGRMLGWTYGANVKGELAIPDFGANEGDGLFSKRLCRMTVMIRWICLTLSCLEEVLAGTEIPGGGGRGRQYLMLHCHHQNDSYSKMGSDKDHFNVSLSVREKVTETVAINHNFWRQRRAETARNQDPSAYQPNALPLGQTGQTGSVWDMAWRMVFKEA